MRRLLVSVVLLVAGCSSDYTESGTPLPPPTSEPERNLDYPSESPSGEPCGVLPWPVSDGDGGLAWESRYIPCGGGPRSPISDPPASDEHDPGPIPNGFDPRPKPPGDPTPW